MMIACPEEIAYEQGFIDARQVKALAAKMNNNSYGTYLRRLVE